MANHSQLNRLGNRQRGVVLVLVTVGMLVMVGIIGLALDGSHAMLNKTRLQNTVDAAALSAAKTLDQTRGDEVLAQAEAMSIITTNAAGLGHEEMQASLTNGDMQVSVQFSNTLNPFVAGSTPAEYVRVRATNLRLPGWFIPVMGFADKTVGATAVAGPSPTIAEICNLAPMMVCGDPAAYAAGDPFYGYQMGQPDVLKTSTSDFEVGPGNFQLVRLDDMTGGADLRRALAGDFDSCITTEEDIPTEPGNTVGPVVQGLNTRFGTYLGPMAGKEDQYPPDVIVDQVEPRLTYDSETDVIMYEGSSVTGPGDLVSHNYDIYKADVLAENYDNLPFDGDPSGPGAYNRRILPLPVGDCSTTTNGAGDVPLMGVLCFYLLQEAEQKGSESHVYGQFIGDGCRVNGRPGPDPVTGPGPYIIQLYKDPDGDAA
jgi:Flp pilus assembly protein TadG